MNLKQRIRDWLDVPSEVDVKEQLKLRDGIEKELTEAKRDVEFWSRELRKRTPKKKCLTCKGEIEVWPFNKTEGYYIKGNRVQHLGCSKADQ